MSVYVAPKRSPLEFLTVGAWSARRGQHAPPHRHAGWKITYYRTGTIDSIVDGFTYRVTPGTVLVLRPNALHAERATSNYSNYYLLVDGPDDQPWPPTCHLDAAHDVGWLIAAILRESSSADQHSDGMVASLLSALDVILRRHDPGEPPSSAHTVVRAAERLFEETYSARLTIAQVADQVGVSSSGLRQHFATVRGISPQATRQQVRLRHAVALLRTSDLPVSAIAVRCGFHSASHLSRYIKLASGTTPGGLRRAGLQGSRPGTKQGSSGHRAG